jgi:hypothetical protein
MTARFGLISPTFAEWLSGYSVRRDFPQGGTLVVWSASTCFNLRRARPTDGYWGTVCLANVAAMSNDPPDLRASHADRDRVVDALRVAGGDGRLSAEELDTRLESALSARTLGELAELTADLPIAPAAKGKDVLVVEQHGGRYVREGRWPVPARIELRTQECRVTLDFTHAVITSNVLRIETDMVHGKLFIVSSPGIVIDTDGLNLTYSKLKLHSKNAAADPRLRIELVGKLLHAKVFEQRP